MEDEMEDGVESGIEDGCDSACSDLMMRAELADSVTTAAVWETERVTAASETGEGTCVCNVARRLK